MMRATTVSITSKFYQKGNRGTGETRTGLVRVILSLCREQMQKDQKEPERQRELGARPSIRSHRDCLHGLLLYLPPRASGRGKPEAVKGLRYQGSIVLERDCLCRCGLSSDVTVNAGVSAVALPWPSIRRPRLEDGRLMMNRVESCRVQGRLGSV